MLRLVLDIINQADLPAEDGDATHGIVGVGPVGNFLQRVAVHQLEILQPEARSGSNGILDKLLCLGDGVGGSIVDTGKRVCEIFRACWRCSAERRVFRLLKARPSASRTMGQPTI